MVLRQRKFRIRGQPIREALAGRKKQFSGEVAQRRTSAEKKQFREEVSRSRNNSDIIVAERRLSTGSSSDEAQEVAQNI